MVRVHRVLGFRVVRVLGFRVWDVIVNVIPLGNIDA